MIVFGSTAKGNFNIFSDIDVCILSPKFKNSIEALEFLWKKRKDEEVMAEIEPIGFSMKEFKKGGALIEEIKKTGIEI